jgi:Helix-turn-helix.
MTQEELARRSGASLTSIKRFEKTGNITLGNFIALMRALGLIEKLEELVPSPESPGPLDLLDHARSAASSARERAPRYKKGH